MSMPRPGFVMAMGTMGVSVPCPVRVLPLLVLPVRMPRVLPGPMGMRMPMVM
ncbi:hypothetical protein V5F77_17525 [Xanthobacter sp. DSM 24535]|uniref:hypothetical protein n=1 Tax=Roseixanthobacter psychrophilus TaxID=3119917 RepID=UPI00372BEB8F